MLLLPSCPHYVARSKQQVFDAFNSMITDKVMPQLPKMFKKMPRTKLELVEQPVKLW